MKISYAITVFNELDEIKRLVSFLLENKREEDEIIVLWDNRGDLSIWQYLEDIFTHTIKNFYIHQNKFDNHFANWKNHLTSLCSGNYIFQIDADEIPNLYLIQNLYLILESNPEVDVYLVPRENYVNGLTQEHIQKWGWKIDEKNRVNWEDYQWRIFKNNQSIKWINKVHEKLDGFKNYSFLPTETEYSLNHTKDIKRQELQNNYYNTL